MDHTFNHIKIKIMEKKAKQPIIEYLNETADAYAKVKAMMSKMPKQLKDELKKREIKPEQVVAIVNGDYTWGLDRTSMEFWDECPNFGEEQLYNLVVFTNKVSAAVDMLLNEEVEEGSDGQSINEVLGERAGDIDIVLPMFEEDNHVVAISLSMSDLDKYDRHDFYFGGLVYVLNKRDQVPTDAIQSFYDRINPEY